MATRPLTPADIDDICRHRTAMFREAGRDAAALAAMAPTFRAWLEPRLADGRYVGWMVEDDGHVVAGLGMMVIEWPPHPTHPDDGRRGSIFNVYVEPSHRRRGLARELMRLALDEARRRGIRHLVLHATEDGRPLYEGLGFRPTSEMALTLT